MQIFEKIRQSRLSAGFTEEQMAEKLGIKRSTYQYWEKKTPSIEKIKRVAKALNLDEDYFFVSDDENKQVIEETETNHYLATRREKKNEPLPFMIPVVPVKAQTGYTHAYDSTDYIRSLDKFPIPPFLNHRGYEWRWFEVDGDSMEPNFYAGDFVLCTLVPFDQWKRLDKDAAYVVVTAEKIMLKRIVPHGKDEWWLESDNKHYKEEPVKMKDVKELWRFRMNINSRDRVTNKLTAV